MNAAYVRMTVEDREKQFHEGEAALYITRAHHRIQTGKLDALKKENLELKSRLEKLEALQEESKQNAVHLQKLQETDVSGMRGDENPRNHSARGCQNLENDFILIPFFYIHIY